MEERINESLIRSYEEYEREQQTGVYPLPIWNLTKCWDGAILNALQISYGDKNIIILITDDLYLELKKLTETPKEDLTNDRD